MSVVHGIVRGHRGAILVRSEPGAGTALKPNTVAEISQLIRDRLYAWKRNSGIG